MDFILSIFAYIQNLGANVMMPIIIAIIGIVLLTKKVFIDFDYDDEVED